MSRDLKRSIDACARGDADARTAFQEAKPHLDEYLRQCSSGKELIERGFSEDVRLASQLDASDSVSALIDNAYMRAEVKDPPR